MEAGTPAPAEPAPEQPGLGSSPDPGWVAAGYIVAAAAIVIGAAIDSGTGDTALAVKDNFSIFAVFYAFAQAEERLLEPISRLWGQPGRANAAKEIAAASATVAGATSAAAAAAASGQTAGIQTALNAAAAAATEQGVAKDKLSKIRANKEVFLWGLATAIAAIACGFLGLRFLETLLDFGDHTPSGSFRFFDLALTALVVGSGTKPLHDLIDRVNKPKPS